MHSEPDGNVKLLNKASNISGFKEISANSNQKQQTSLNIYDLDPATLNTLDEPISTTLKRDLYMIGFKLKYVLNPRIREEGAKELRNWDLWGPLLLCLLLAFMLSIKAGPNSPEVIFGTVFVVIWAGAFVLTINAQLLGGKISFFQSVCVLGYCVFPIDIVAIVLTCIEIFSTANLIVGIVCCSLAYFWATASSIGFMKALVSDQKKILAAYPVMLFYLFLSWFVLITSSDET